jgi:hypothetical protein
VEDKPKSPWLLAIEAIEQALSGADLTPAEAATANFWFDRMVDYHARRRGVMFWDPEGVLH